MRIATTLVGWAIAFLIVLALLTALGDQIESLPRALNALVFTAVLVPVMGNLVMPHVGAWVARLFGAEPAPAARTRHAHAELAQLPPWPPKTIAVLSTIADGPYAIPVSAPVRSGARRVLLSLRADRGSLARLQARPQVALTVLTSGDTALTARGHARVVAHSMASAPRYAAIAIDVDRIDDHRQPEFIVEAGVGRRWLSADEQRSLAARVHELCAVAASLDPAAGSPRASDRGVDPGSCRSSNTRPIP